MILASASLTWSQTFFAASIAWVARLAASRAAFSANEAASLILSAIAVAFLAASCSALANLPRSLTGELPFLIAYRLARNSVAYPVSTKKR